ncbi:hypothetical protein, partial [Roseburia sp. 1XD42-69]|uniref:hypothetical protein n=1 Tax=Roseburia sp. 1XD42-69 TaxID=2320088 RepID=UPI001A9B804F
HTLYRKIKYAVSFIVFLTYTLYFTLPLQRYIHYGRSSNPAPLALAVLALLSFPLFRFWRPASPSRFANASSSASAVICPYS